VTAQLRQAMIDWHVNVVVSDGVVHLWGAVESDAQKHAAHVAAEQVPGVTEVQNHLSVLPSISQEASGAW
jgi:osmotically-inducible protein OsmY